MPHSASRAYEIKRMPVPMRTEGSIAPMSNPMFRGEPPYTGAWAGCAYDPETPGPIHHPDQIRVPSQIDDVMRLFAKAMVRERPEPDQMITWARDWFEARVSERR